MQAGHHQKSANAKIPYGSTFLDGPVANSPYMTDNAKAGYRRTATELTFWDSPDARGLLSKDYQFIVQNFTAYLVVESTGDILYQVDWSVRNYWNNGDRKREFVPPVGKIVTELPAFLSNPKKQLYRYNGAKDIPNPIKTIPTGLFERPIPLK